MIAVADWRQNCLSKLEIDMRKVVLTIGPVSIYSRPGGSVPSAEDEKFMLLPFERDTALTVLRDS